MVSLPAFFLRSTSRNESRGAAARPEWRREHGVHRSLRLEWLHHVESRMYIPHTDESLTINESIEVS
ncbi:unnamed protein product [Penicillium roqueforti FM164]|uniref:Genomic scaffold, ProqFM164S01 n=1 Tax=Penicillium roqueforti (strain FM164) TaxID=1365484 RepID=W6PS82_PENRF|nr:unnamed protein product [Penicillium roqueforti FM164]